MKAVLVVQVPNFRGSFLPV